jgi:glycosyltransferase involved in cell wall biosynthesis
MKKIKVIQIVRGVGPTSMPWNDLHSNIKKLSPGLSFPPMVIGKLFGKSVWKLKISSNGCNYLYLESSVFSSLIFIFKLISRAEKSNSRIVFHVHNPSLFIVALFIKLFFKKAFLVTNLHNDWRFFKWHQKFGLRILSAVSDKFITVSYSIRETIPVYIKKKLEGERLCSIPNGIDSDKLSQYKIDNHREKIAIIIARMVPQKNCFFILDMLAKAPFIEKIIWVGDGYQKSKIIECAKLLGLSNKLNLVGVVTRAQVYELLIDSSVYIAASKWEGIGVANLEAAALGCYPFLSDIPPHREISENIEIDVHSLSDVNEWVKSLGEFLKAKPSIQTSKREKISKLSKEKYNLTSAVQRYIAIYSDFL